MSIATSVHGTGTGVTSADARPVVASYPTYQQARLAVDLLSDSAFPVEHTAIVGRDLTLIEQVTGRMTTGRASVIGAASGAWFGLFIGLLIGLFTVGPIWLTLIVAGIVIGGAWGAVFGAVAHWMTRGQRDFASASGLVAARYEVAVDDAYAERARHLLSTLG